MSGLLFRDVDIGGGRPTQVRVVDQVIVAIDHALRPRLGDRVIDGGGGALIPGLHDHHLHVLGAIAAHGSVKCGPPDVTTSEELGVVLRDAADLVEPEGYARGVGYHEDVAGVLDRHALDRLVVDVPVRVQHRSGRLWMLNTAALSAVGLVGKPAGLPDGVELAEDGRPTGRLWGADPWLRAHGGVSPRLDLTAFGRRLASTGITGLTDATVDLDIRSTALLGEAARDSRLPQRLMLLGLDELSPARDGDKDRVVLGPRKLMLADHDLPSLPDLVATIESARRMQDGRPVAIHCVTRTALVLALTALQETGSVRGDRIEHASVVPPELIPVLRRLGVAVVIQPSLLTERGDAYLRHVDMDDRGSLYRHHSLISAGVPVALSSDAPYSTLDPWATMRAATQRTTPTGVPIGLDERVAPAEALRAMQGRADDPGGRPRRVAVGEPADLCLLDVPLGKAIRNLSAEHVVLTVIAGQIVYARGQEYLGKTGPRTETNPIIWA